MTVKSQVVGVIGPRGFGGSHLSLELIQRGHKVVGISRHPEGLGKHPSYIPRAVDLEKVSIGELATAFQGLDALVSEYAPHTAGTGALLYMPFLEVVRKIFLAVQHAKVPYFAFVGGAGSLHVPNTEPPECLIDAPDFLLAYRRALADSEIHVQYMQERLGVIGEPLRAYRTARLALRDGTATPEQKLFIDEYEQPLRDGSDPAKAFISAARTAWLFFAGNVSFPWTFVSPSPMYRPGKRTGTYEVTVDEVPLKEVAPGAVVDAKNPFDGRLTGISVADLAIAIADELEERRYMHQHWTAVGDLSDDTTQYPSYIRL